MIFKPPADHLPSKQRGYTLIELLTVLAIVALLISMAIPNLQRIGHEARANQILYTLEHLLQFARLTSMIEQTPVIVCPSVDQIHCNNTPSNRWSDPLIVMLKPTAFENRQATPVIRHIQTLLNPNNPHEALYFSGFQSDNLLQFDPLDPTLNTNSHNGTFTLTVDPDRNPVHQKRIIINRSGRIRIVNDLNRA